MNNTEEKMKRTFASIRKETISSERARLESLLADLWITKAGFTRLLDALYQARSQVELNRAAATIYAIPEDSEYWRYFYAR